MAADREGKYGEKEIYKLTRSWKFHGKEKQLCVGSLSTDGGGDAVAAAKAVITAEINMAAWRCCNHQLIV